MKRKEFLATSAAGALGLQADRLPLPDLTRGGGSRDEARNILIAGGGFGAAFLGQCRAEVQTMYEEFSECLAR